MARPRTSDHRPSLIAVPDVQLGAATGHARKLDDTTQRTGTTWTTHRGARRHPFGGGRQQYMKSRKERAISLPYALIGCVQIMLGISAHDPSIGCRAASRELAFMPRLAAG